MIKSEFNVKCTICNEFICYKFSFINLLLYKKNLILKCPKCKKKTIVKINTLGKKREITLNRKNLALNILFFDPLTLFTVIIVYFPTNIIMKNFLLVVICCFSILGITAYSQYKKCCKYIQYYIYLS